VAAFEVSTAGFDQLERDTVDGHRWWTLAELQATGERIYPPDLPVLLGSLLAGTVARGEPC
jgi:hypothetical protein